ncbi:hypothetical protein PHYSODRAFT_527571 [Phytophthora sojae]|uniref:DUF6818 domain-containing protein n=1 Tax=Phytophthora sojae (strain P6497) TaxID=1094619 RepID=G5A8F0_PHYSP|nr:hypothetical protein PHYSODRAFT_527571 [Phytophthora sojae]EGZ08176.1 hypothetical protein PHYSODRAFT_527571 [Phytophthora sojae]|eukprot:XP_009536348.1 hypothetical protein PHYSODRAFT_527571 [Phytophthora sojae]
MLDVVEAILPFGAEQWQNAVSQFNTNIPAGWTERDGDSLKRKFQKLVRVPKPTGTAYLMCWHLCGFQLTYFDLFVRERNMSRAGAAPASTDSQLTQTPTATSSTPTAPSTPLQATPRADRIIDTVNNDIQASHNASDPSQSMLAMMMAMEERQQARDAQYRHERELCQRQRDEREAANQQMMMMLLLRLVERGGGAASSGEQHGNDTDAGLENKLE